MFEEEETVNRKIAASCLWNSGSAPDGELGDPFRHSSAAKPLHGALLPEGCRDDVAKQRLLNSGQRLERGGAPYDGGIKYARLSVRRDKSVHRARNPFLAQMGYKDCMVQGLNVAAQASGARV
jgi:hypothetical protein